MKNIDNMKIEVADLSEQGKISTVKAKSLAEVVDYVFSLPGIDEKYQAWLEKRKQRRNSNDKT